MKLELMPMFWLAFTLLAYLFSRWLYRRTGRYVLSPLILVPALLLALAVPLHTAYAEYSSNTHWLMLVLGPVTVAFAVPIWQQRRLLVRHWSALLLGILAGSAASIATSFGLAKALALDSSVTLSLVPRSITTPFAMPLAQDLGGVPELTAVFVMFTGVIGAMLGGVLLKWLPLRSALARGALFAVGAHGAGVSRAHEVGGEEGSVAGLVMVLTGLLNLFAAPLLASLL
ncbi:MULTISPECIES: LrgB family protein [Pseudomonas]|uniref:Membrane protein n=1 Tax=Pseudomonas fluorescens TaxID=294 RepID=A0AAE2A6S7_PSEFL|nr:MULTISPECIES: LrgB family protein [Pseudomonas]KIF59575.1 membrane protein [Pseudomonas fluorescens]MBP4001819.1 LrgB family protein [Pseudomonas koreensis]POA39160.1 LrgB family protein [Pseudomonas sp. GW456-12-1-14-TSB6]TFA83667.1 putative effector of murein hydrolase [Pseudomonas sp. LAIL14HWK12:I2]SCZ24812.1 Putative effector of murein hydrolase [Pseudomonas sp. NFIX46]